MPEVSGKSDRKWCPRFGPHTPFPRVGTIAQTSAVWKIVEEWNQGKDGDGVPFREKLYAVFPGFEPSLKQGRSGLHLLFLLIRRLGEKTISRRSILLWVASTHGYENNVLQLSNRGAEDAFHELKAFMIESVLQIETRVNGGSTLSWPHMSTRKKGY